MTEWDGLTLLARWLVYISLSTSIGGAISLRLLRRQETILPRLRLYTLVSLMLGFFTSTLYYFVRVGAFAEAGLAGMFDPVMREVLWNSPVGGELLSRLLGLCVLFAALILTLPTNRSGRMGAVEVLSLLLGCLLLGASFARTGHTTQLDFFASALLALHVVLATWWIGSIYPLWLVTHRLSRERARHVLERFGELAINAVVLLVIAGGILLWRLTGGEGLLTTPYGFWVVCKGALVALILVIAAYHRYQLVPVLMDGGSRHQLKKSLALEKVVGWGIFGATTVLATLVGPAH
ncbi:copper resistance D family protein [Marinobacterium lutimaris]|uniref:Copper resistance protein D n=1 Tax=Marinobacterium lutimaris TaxID=568106 RepID=A0A1H5X4D2_9GAMM|nr:CopD family protein [Marinobacterium lutimaris]SEG06679.1 putative copper resistance protein D [Marinobacterium lutimaris]